MRPLSTFALSKFDIARTVQCLSDASLRDMPRFLPPVCAFSSSTSLQSFKRFINNVKYLRNKKTDPYTVKATLTRKLTGHSEIITCVFHEWVLSICYSPVLGYSASVARYAVCSVEYDFAPIKPSIYSNVSTCNVSTSLFMLSI